MEMFNGRPGDVRNFIHKRIIGAVTGFAGSVLSGGNPLIGAARGFVGGGGGGPAPSPVRGTQIITRVAQAGTLGCNPGFFRDPSGNCVPLFQPRTGGIRGLVEEMVPFGATGRTGFGEAVLGQFGAALEPGFRDTQVAVCPRGTVLGMDGFCYNKRDIKNSERKWPAGRKPLLTGGEMRCISIAASAAKKLQRKEKQLQSMGMLKKPSTSRRRALPSGHHAHVSHD